MTGHSPPADLLTHSATKSRSGPAALGLIGYLSLGYYASGKRKYLYRAVNKLSQTAVFLLTARRHVAAERHFFEPMTCHAALRMTTGLPRRRLRAVRLPTAARLGHDRTSSIGVCSSTVPRCQSRGSSQLRPFSRGNHRMSDGVCCGRAQVKLKVASLRREKPVSRLTGWVLLLLACHLMQGCATNIVYSNGDRIQRALTAPLGASMYIDRDGDLYPPRSVSLGGSLFTASRGDTATLRAYFQKPSSQADWLTVLRVLDRSPVEPFDVLWEKAQQGLVERVAGEIVAGSEGGVRAVVFLVHGYNNDFSEAERWYKLVEADIRERFALRGSRSPFFVRVHWDGLSQAVPIGIWTKAQWNGPLTGLAIRKVLRAMEGRLSESAELSILSHSTGALVAVNAVGDGSAALDCKDNFKEHCPEIQRKDTVPKLVSRVRLGLLIPAASLDTFDAFDSTSTSPAAVVLGLNRQDFPTNKIFSCRILGSTCLNVDGEGACRKLTAALGARTSVDWATFEFSNSSKHEGQEWLFWESHSVEDQMKRDRWPSFINRVLFAQPNTAAAGQSRCESR